METPATQVSAVMNLRHGHVNAEVFVMYITHGSFPSTELEYQFLRTPTPENPEFSIPCT